MKVMIVEDESGIREILRTLLEDEGFDVSVLENGDDLLRQLDLQKPDLLLLDVVLPGRSGLELIKEIRATESTKHLPVIMVTGLSGENDKVAAFDLGADDYVTKPFYPKELAARIKALARRSDFPAAKAPKKITRNTLTIDFAAHRVTLEGKDVPLTLTEFKILSELLKESGRVLTRERLRESALGNLNVTDRTIDVHMASLRKKLESIGDNIETVRGVGYRFAE